MPNARILIVDDEEGILEVCSDILRKLPQTEIVLESRSEQAAERLSTETFDLIIADIRMPGIDGVALLRIARQKDPDLAVLMLTAFPSIETAVESMKLGATDYITKPFLPDDLLATVGRILEQQRLRQENRLLSRLVDRAYCFDEIIGKSAAMQAVFEKIERIAATEVDVLIIGETGTGKELVARSIHRRSLRKKARFVPVDCGAIPAELLESEFFGHERGAFTGAHARRMGLLEFATQGTFFMDEIGELPPLLQAKLLRVLQERKIRRVGGQEEIPVDVRVMAATGRDLILEMKEHRFREDLFYRINVARIEILPLRERQEDIPLLVEHFVDRYSKELARGSVRVDSKTMEILQHYPWPGNVRELQNVLKRTLAMIRNDVLTLEDLPDEVLIRAAASRGVKSEHRGNFFKLRAQRIEAFEKEYLVHFLHIYMGDVKRGANEEGIPRASLYRLLKKYNLNPEQFRYASNHKNHQE